MTFVTQLLGLLALLSWVSSVQWKSKSGILRLQIVASVFYCLHYGLLDATSAAAVSVVSIARLLTIYLIERKGRTVPISILFLFIGLLVLVGFLTYDSLLSLIPIIITILYTYGTWQNNTYLLRIIFFCCGWMWFYFNYQVGSYILIIGNTLEIVSSTVSFFRFGLFKEKSQKKQSAE
jgi:hypothetical protein